jgi:hypothetical protein
MKTKKEMKLADYTNFNKSYVDFSKGMDISKKLMEQNKKTLKLLKY